MQDLQEPLIIIKPMAIFLAVLASFIFGFLWYGPLFGKKWGALMKMDMKKKPKTSVMVKAMALNVLGTFLIAYVLSHNQQAWRPSTWGAGIDGSNAMYGFLGGFFTWLGFFIPMLLNTVAWEMRPWSLFALNAVYHFLNLQIIAHILANWR